MPRNDLYSKAEGEISGADTVRRNEAGGPTSGRLALVTASEPAGGTAGPRLRILVLALNYEPEPIGAALYTSGLCGTLVERGHAVEVVCAQPYYPAWRISDGFRNRWSRDREHGVVVHRCPLYVPAVPNGKKRVLHHLSFALAAIVPMFAAALRRRPDLVLTVAPSILAAPVAWAAARLTGAPAWLHLQDFEAEAAFATGLIAKSSRRARIAKFVEGGIIRRFDRVSSISAKMCERLAAIVPNAPVVEFRNWADVDPEAPEPETTFRYEWGLEGRFIALYSGNLANKQGIEIILDAARLLADRPDIVLLVCGDGSSRAAFAQAAAGCANIVLKPLQASRDLSRLLATADIHLLPQRGGAADLVLPSKLTNMLASGRPVVATAAPGTGLYAEVDGCGPLVTPGDAQGFADAIRALADDPARRGALAGEARRRAQARWNRSAILDDFERDLIAIAAPAAIGAVAGR